MINTKTITVIIIVAILIGVLYVFIEKNLTPAKSLSQSESSSSELTKNAPSQTTVISLPTPEPTLPPINESSDLIGETNTLDMRDYSSYFEELKDTVTK